MSWNLASGTITTSKHHVHGDKVTCILHTLSHPHTSVNSVGYTMLWGGHEGFLTQDGLDVILAFGWNQYDLKFWLVRLVPNPNPQFLRPPEFCDHLAVVVHHSLLACSVVASKGWLDTVSCVWREHVPEMLLSLSLLLPFLGSLVFARSLVEIAVYAQTGSPMLYFQ